ncbi:P-loop containing nucleoside triphosphate hydrolase protein [Cladochytrium replicatum]|nr:P-loop containing nucleoside triphosphate hydrolase protein [Cladochytrium replicatum]
MGENQPVMLKEVVEEKLLKELKDRPSDVNQLPPKRKEINPNFFEFLFLTWMEPLFRLGSKKPLEQADLMDLNPADRSRSVAHVLDPYWKKVSKYLENPMENKRPSFVSLVLWHFRWKAFIWFFCSSLSVASFMMTPVLLRELLAYLLAKSDAERATLTINSGIGIAVILFLAQIVGAVAKVSSQQMSRDAALRLRTMLIGAIYDKSLRINGDSAQTFTQGQILNMVNVDTDQIIFFILGTDLVGIPVQVIVSIYLLHVYLGTAIWAGVGTLLGVMLLQMGFIVLLTKYEGALLAASDKRLKLVRELLYAMKVVKFRAWEELFEKKVDGLRGVQVDYLKKNNLMLIVFATLGQITPVIMPIVSFIAYQNLTGSLNPVIVYPALTLFTSLFGPLIELPQIIPNAINMAVSWKRISSFLATPESEPIQYTDFVSSEGVSGAKLSLPLDPDVVVSISGASFKWPLPKTSADDKKKGKRKQKSTVEAKVETDANNGGSGTSSETALSENEAMRSEKHSLFGKKQDPLIKLLSAEPFLNNIDIAIKRGSLTAVVGAVGAGKSSLLSAIIGEMEKASGSLALGGKIAYCAQQPWTLSDTLRGNICFFREYDETKMNTALDVCSLRRDLADFPGGELTEIGEKGVNLSGGQKARVALARAIYAGEGEPDEDVADIYLLDDPISALDAHVGVQVFQDCILEHLVQRRHKTVILVTHQLHLLRFCDRVIVMDHGSIVEDGTVDSLMEAKDPEGNPGHLAEMMKNYTVGQQDKRKEKEKQKVVIEDADGEQDGIVTEEEEEEKEKDEEEKKRIGGLIEEEDREHGAVRWSVYTAYAKAGGGWTLFGTGILLAVLMEVAAVGANVWLSYWIGGLTNLDTLTNLAIYSSLGGAQALFLLLLNVVMLVISIVAAIYFHKAALIHMLNSPMSFFDANPIGRIMNRFSRDVTAIDQRLIFVMFLFTLGASGLLGSLVGICFASPIMLAVIFPIAAVYWFLLNYYRSTLRELKRLDSNARSPLYSHISETLAGVMSVRAYGAEARFVEKERDLMDFSTEPLFLRWSSAGWIAIRISILASLITLVLAIIGLYSGGTGTAFIGLGLSYAVTITEQIGTVLEALAMLETEMNAVERMVHYAQNLPQERARRLETDPDVSEWPKRGAISFVNLELRYESRPDTAVIKDLSADIRPGERVALVGRTGSGKSSLVTAMFRIIESSRGSVVIDGRDISDLGLYTLRSRMQIIPQEPVLFEGTIRTNLDLEDELADDDIWNGLEQVGLKAYVLKQEKKLDAPITEGGENLSVGQRQLMCLARAILKKPRILVMDEATASVDTKADKLIQESIETHFRETTVISIAHRLNTIAGFDRVMVLDGGNLIEFDSPHTLLKNPASLFTSLVDATGKENAQVLRKIASDKERERQDNAEKSGLNSQDPVL